MAVQTSCGTFLQRERVTLQTSCDSERVKSKMIKGRLKSGDTHQRGIVRRLDICSITVVQGRLFPDLIKAGVETSRKWKYQTS